MTVYLETEAGAGELLKELPLGEIAETVFSAFLEEENCPYEASVSVTVTDDVSIRAINLEQRQIDKSTDVLSFPMIQYDVPGNYDFLENMGAGAFDPDTGELFLGDIVISAEHVKAQAYEYGHSEKREFAFLIVHSLLHLTGYDHMTAEDAEYMEEKQKTILAMCGIGR